MLTTTAAYFDGLRTFRMPEGSFYRRKKRKKLFRAKEIEYVV